jgi:hypothetical protein
VSLSLSLSGTHYEAMDVDTPPAQMPLPPTQSQVQLEPLSFDAKKDFDRRQALGLNRELDIREVVMADNAEDLVRHEDTVEERTRSDGDEEGDKRLTLTRRRNHAKTLINQNKASRVTVETDDDDDDEEGEEEEGEGEGGFLGTLQKTLGKNGGGRGRGRGEFSFQVHHHHAPSSSASIGGNGSSSTTNLSHNSARWLQSNTPYVLLGLVRIVSFFFFLLHFESY